jgi:capsular exopolysaccharide synthesis family protein
LNEPTPDLRAYLRPIIDRWWLIVLVVAFVTAAAYVYYSSSENETYRATTTLLARTSPVESALLGEQPTQVDTTELAALIESRATSEAVHGRHRGERLSGSINAQTLEDTTSNTSTPARLMTITATSDSAKGAARLANAYATTFASLTSSRTRGQVAAARQRNERELADLGRGPENEGRRRELTREIRRLSGIERLPAAGIEQIDPALPGARIASDVERKTIFAFAVSLMLALGVAYLLAWADPRVRHVDELKDLYGVPVVGAVPHAKDPARGGDGPVALPPALRDAFRGIRVNLELSQKGRPARTILVTSAMPGEGRSTVVRNLALAYREAGRRAAVIEADLRDPRLAELFLLSAGPGLAEVLRGDHPLSDALQEVSAETVVATQGGNGVGAATVEPGGSVAVLTGGGQTEESAEPVSAETIRPLLEEAADRYDVVIVDSPPLLPLSDSVRLLSAVDGVLLVARLRHTRRDSATEAHEVVERLGDVTFLGVVANDVPKGRVSASRA